MATKFSSSEAAPLLLEVLPRARSQASLMKPENDSQQGRHNFSGKVGNSISINARTDGPDDAGD
jgi:hypothetical protein